MASPSQRKYGLNPTQGYLSDNKHKNTAFLSLTPHQKLIKLAALCTCWLTKRLYKLVLRANQIAAKFFTKKIVGL